MQKFLKALLSSLSNEKYRAARKALFIFFYEKAPQIRLCLTGIHAPVYYEVHFGEE